MTNDKIDLDEILLDLQQPKIVDRSMTGALRRRQRAKKQIQELIVEARVEENKQGLYIFENQVSKQVGVIGYLAGADRDLSKGLAVEHDGQKLILAPDNVDFSLPQFFKDRIAQLQDSPSKRHHED